MNPMNLFDLNGQVAVVTGGNGGIGRSLALGFAQAGASVAIIGRNEEKNHRVLGELQEIGNPSAALRIDLNQRDQLAPAIELAAYNIQVNAVAPGWFPTDLTAPVRSPEMKEMNEMNDEIMARTAAGGWQQL